MVEQYGSKKGESVFYASANKGTITGIEKRKHANKGGLISGFPKLAKKIQEDKMAWKGYAPLGKSKVIPTPDANRNNKPVAVSKDKKDKNPVTGTRAARSQKPVTWYQYVVQCN